MCVYVYTTTYKWANVCVPVCTSIKKTLIYVHAWLCVYVYTHI